MDVGRWLSPKGWRAARYFNWGTLALQAGNYSEAAPYFLEAIRLWPNFREAHNNLGWILIHQGKPADALEIYDWIVNKWPKFAEGHNNRGTALASLSLYREAAAEFGTALEIKPEYGRARDNLEQALERLKPPPVTFHPGGQAVQGRLVGLPLPFPRGMDADVEGNLARLRSIFDDDDAAASYLTCITFGICPYCGAPIAPGREMPEEADIDRWFLLSAAWCDALSKNSRDCSFIASDHAEWKWLEAGDGLTWPVLVRVANSTRI